MIQALLLDTCAAMWLMNNDEMTDEAVAAIDGCSDTGRPIFVSPITAWEVGNLGRKGRFKSNLSPQRWFEALRSTAGIQMCELSGEVLLQSSYLPGKLHRDPADRIIAATAREYGFTVMTRDLPLLDYAREGYLSAVEC